GVGQRRALVARIVEEVARPVVGAVVRAGELLQREGLTDPPAKLARDELDLRGETRVGRRVRAHALESACSILPLLARELDVHGGADNGGGPQPAGGHSGGAAAGGRWRGV